MVLIPYEDIDKLKSGAKNFEQVLTALSTQYLPTSQTPGDPLSRLDAELSKTLNESSSNISDNNKLKQYSELLRRYLFFKNKPHEGNSTVEKIENSEVIPETADFSGINRDSEISNISINNSNAEQNKSYKVSDIVNGVPKTYQTAAENILRHIESVDNGERLKWDNKGSVTLDDRKIPGANIVDLINDAVCHRKTVKATDDVWEADLVEIKSLKTYNDGVSFILVVIDVLSKYVWVESLLDKSAKSVLQGFKNIFDRNKGRTPITLQKDKGKEFVAGTVQDFLKSKDIIFRTARNPDVKCAVVERVNRTLKERMWRYFTHKKTYRFIDILQQLVKAYNNTKHSSIKMQPSAETIYNAKTAWDNIRNQFKPIKPRRKPLKYKMNDYVRISKYKSVFEKGYEAGYTEEIFQVTKSKLRQNIPIYEIKDLIGEDIDGFFYEQELSCANKDLEKEKFIIEKIIKTKGKGKNKQYFVKWQGYPDKFNSWVLASTISE
ncbi:uncharacterized protein LOC123261342 [Cotesia glomerata]|uniref:uncharacterized protein LOC123261342 n=1 Tax=Cotesia glomerata TaxID=32391 RepID=UPI001D0161DB|nr:uncharacterized protein LOC123261342 [Cotesia glomerata]